MALVFDKDLDAVPGRVDQIGPSIRRVLAPNPGPFTYLGTGTYIVGHGTVAVIDPGPDSTAHLDALVSALRGEQVSYIICTHTHPDHSPGSRRLQQLVGGSIVGCGPHPVDVTAESQLETASTEPPTADTEATETAAAGSGHDEERSDADHVPEWQMFESDTVGGPGWTLQAVETPGHISNHLCFAFAEEGVLFSGDHVMAWSTSVVSPPAGDLNSYLGSLDKVKRRAETLYWPTHGPSVRNPQQFVQNLYQHRLARTEQILTHLASGPKTIPELVASMYPGLDTRLVKAAGRSVLAHLLALRQDDLVVSDSSTNEVSAHYSLR